jgi:hypothetical protein
MGDPNKLPNAEDVSIEERIPLAITRSVLSAAHGIKDVEHYLGRFVITVLLFGTVMLVVIAILVGIQEVLSRI